MPTYTEKLKDPRWQKKRLEIMEAANFECTNCGAADKPLNIHHSAYLRGYDPWEYPNTILYCLCENCHKKSQDTLESIQWFLAHSFDEHEKVLGYLKAIVLSEHPDNTCPVASYEEAHGFADYYGLKPWQIINAVNKKGLVAAIVLAELRASERPKENAKPNN